MLDWVEARNKEYQEAIGAKKAELLAEAKRLGEKPPEGEELQIAAENRLYEQTLKEIMELMDRYKKAWRSETKAELAQQIRNAQSKALYFAQEAYYTQAAIEHVVFTIQAAKRGISVESLMAKGPPEMSIPLTEVQGRQSYIEQIANMMKQLSKEGDAAKLSAKASKYFLRALDAAKIAGLDLKAFRPIVEATVEVEANRGDVAKVKKLLKERYGEDGGETYNRLVQEASNKLTVLLFGEGLRTKPVSEAAAKEAPAKPKASAVAEAPVARKPSEAASRKPSEMASAETIIESRPGPKAAVEESAERPQTPWTSDHPLVRRLWIEGQKEWNEKGGLDVDRRLGMLEDIDGFRRTLNEYEKIIADRAFDVYQRLAKTNPEVAELGKLNALLQFNLKARAEGISPEALVAEFARYNGVNVSVKELAKAAGISEAGAKEAMDWAEAKIIRGTKPEG